MDDLRDHRKQKEEDELDKPQGENNEAVSESKNWFVSFINGVRQKTGEVMHRTGKTIGVIGFGVSTLVNGVMAEAQGPKQPVQVAANEKNTAAIQSPGLDAQYDYFIYWSKKEGSQYFINWNGVDVPVEKHPPGKVLNTSGMKGVRIFHKKDKTNNLVFVVVDGGTPKKYRWNGKALPKKNGTPEVATQSSVKNDAPIPSPKVNTASDTDAKDKKIDENSIKEIGLNSWHIVPPEIEKNGEGWRGPSVQTEGIEYKNLPNILSQEVLITAEKWGQHVQTDQLFPIIRSIGETQLHEADFKIEVKDIANAQIELKFVRSQPNNNQFLSVRLRGNPQGRGGTGMYRIMMKSEVTQGSVPLIKNEKYMEYLSQKNMPAASAQVMQALQTQVNLVHQNIRFDQDTSYRGTLRTIYDSRGQPQVVGDCSAQSLEVLKGINHPAPQIMSGFTAAAVIPAMHVWIELPGSVKGDPVSGQVSSTEYGDLINAVGREFIFERGSPFYGQVTAAPNGGLITLTTGCKNIEVTDILLSVPGKGPFGAMLTERQQHASVLEKEKVEARIKKFETERKAINSDHRIAQK